MLSYEDIVEAPLGKLKAAADDWSEMATKLNRLADHASDGMKAKADKASWEGLNAGVTRAFVGKTVKEFADAAAEAKGVKTLLEEGYAAFKKAKDDLVNIRDHEGPAAGIRVDGRGKVTARSPISENNAARHDPDFGKYLQQERENIASWQKKIDHIVETCNDTDVTFKNSLEANVTDRKDFSAPKYTKFDQEEAARAVALAAKGRDLTHTELQALNELLRDNGKSVEFAKNFYEKLGPEKALAFFGQLATDTNDYAKVDKERLADVQALQRNLGLNLATASYDKAFTAECRSSARWEPSRSLLSKYDNSGGPYGYQLLGGIMRYGNYDAKFLNPIAEHVAQLHQQDPYRFAGNKQVNGFLDNPYNPSGKNGSGYDPTTAMLEALGNSPTRRRSSSPMTRRPTTRTARSTGAPRPTSASRMARPSTTTSISSETRSGSRSRTQLHRPGQAGAHSPVHAGRTGPCLGGGDPGLPDGRAGRECEAGRRQCRCHAEGHGEVRGGCGPAQAPGGLGGQHGRHGCGIYR